MSVVSMVAILVISWLLGVAAPFIAVQAIVLGGAAAFILTRPTYPQ
jgi:hypothetical protein